MNTPTKKRYRQRPCAAVTIDPNATPLENLVDRQFGKWVVKAFYGKRTTTSATHVNVNGDPVRNSSEMWTCVCECGRTGTVLRGNLLPRKDGQPGKSTQCMHCQIAARTTPQNLRTGRWKVWRRVRDNQTWGMWANFQLWDAKQPKQPGERLLRKDASLPHGPDNSFYGTEAPQYAADIALIAETDGTTVKATRLYYADKTRQAVSQAAKAIRERKGAVG